MFLHFLRTFDRRLTSDTESYLAWNPSCCCIKSSSERPKRPSTSCTRDRRSRTIRVTSTTRSFGIGDLCTSLPQRFPSTTPGCARFIVQCSRTPFFSRIPHNIYLALSDCNLTRNAVFKGCYFPFYKRFCQVRWIEQEQLSHHLLDQRGADHCANANTRPALVGFYRVALPGERWALTCGTAWNILGYHMKPPWAVQKEDQVPFLSSASTKGLWFEVIGLWKQTNLSKPENPLNVVNGDP